MSNEPYPGTQAILRAIALLKAFTDDRPELGLSDLARIAGLNKTTAYRLLTALESEGLVVRAEAADTYRLGPEVIVLGGRALRANSLRSVSRAELESLARQTGEAATLEVLADGEILILDEAAGSHLIGAAPAIGTRWPAHATSTGKLLLAYTPPAELEQILPLPLAQLTGRTVATMEALRREVTRMGRQGYATAVDELEVGYVGVSAPVFNHEGQAIAAVSVGGPVTRLTPERIPDIVALLREAAGRISERLGFRPDQESKRTP